MAVGFIVAAAAAGILLIPGLVIVIAAGVAAGRGDPDDSGRRGRAVYLGVTSFVALFVALFASFGIVVSLTMLIGPDNTGPSPMGSGSSGLGFGSYSSSAQARSGSSGPIFTVPSTMTTVNPGSVFQAIPHTGSRNNEVVSGALGAGLVGLAAGVVLFLHLPRLWEMLGDEESRRGGVGRTLSTYLNATSFLSVFIAALAGASALYGLYRLIAPGVALTSGRSSGTRQLIDSAYLTVTGALIFLVHRRTALNPPSTPPD